MSDRIERYSCPFCISADESHVIVYKNIIKEKTPRKKPSSKKATPAKNSRKSSSRTATPSRDNGKTNYVQFDIPPDYLSSQPTNISQSTVEIFSKLEGRASKNVLRSSSSQPFPTSLFSDELAASLGSVPVVLSSLMETTIQTAARFSTSPVKGEDTSKNVPIINYIAEAHQKKFKGPSISEIPIVRLSVNEGISSSPLLPNVTSENVNFSGNSLPQLNKSVEEKFLTDSNCSAVSENCLLNGLKKISCDGDVGTENVLVVQSTNGFENFIGEELCVHEDKFLEDSMVSTSKTDPSLLMKENVKEVANEEDRLESSSFSVHSNLENDADDDDEIESGRKNSDVVDSESDESKENIVEMSSAEWIQNEEGLLLRTPRCNKSEFHWKPTGELCTIKIREKKSVCDVEDYLANFREKNRCASKLNELLADDCSRSSSEGSEHSCAKSDLVPTHSKLLLEKCQNVDGEVSPNKHVNYSSARRALISIPETPEDKLKQRLNARKNSANDIDDVEVVPQTPIGKIRRESYAKKMKLNDLLKNEDSQNSSGEGTMDTQSSCIQEPLLTLNNGGDGSVSSMSRRSQQLLDAAELGDDAFTNSSVVASRKRPLPRQFSQRNTAKRTLFR